MKRIKQLITGLFVVIMTLTCFLETNLVSNAAETMTLGIYYANSKGWTGDITCHYTDAAGKWQSITMKNLSNAEGYPYGVAVTTSVNKTTKVYFTSGNKKDKSKTNAYSITSAKKRSSDKWGINKGSLSNIKEIVQSSTPAPKIDSSINNASIQKAADEIDSLSNTLKGYLKGVGSIVCIVGLGLTILASKDDNSDAKVKGITVFIVGAVLYSLQIII